MVPGKFLLENDESAATARVERKSPPGHGHGASYWQPSRTSSWTPLSATTRGSVAERLHSSRCTSTTPPTNTVSDALAALASFGPNHLGRLYSRTRRSGSARLRTAGQYRLRRAVLQSKGAIKGATLLAVLGPGLQRRPVRADQMDTAVLQSRIPYPV